jgi:DMSO/TMAO reductase YedYZ molybdopterin-dependent catalytic subunit
MFEGVLLSDLLEVAGVPDSASKVSLTALDDYKVDFTVDDARSSQMLLAPDSSSLGRNPDLWIWSVSSMEVA